MVTQPDGRPFTFIYEAEWNDIPCSDYPLTPEKWVEESIGPLIDSQVDALFYNLCSSDGYCCQLNSGQILMDNFDQVADAWVWRYRENTKALVSNHANPPDLAVEQGHRLGLKVAPVVRMNDPHDQYYKYEVSAFKLENPELLIGHKTGYVDWEKGVGGHPQPDSLAGQTWGLFDYAHQKVRDHKLAIIEEFVTRWDNDGLSLDFERSPVLFAEEGSDDNCRILTDFIRQVRDILERTARKRGRAQFLHVRVLPDLDQNWRRGMDVGTWIAEGLVDAVSPGCGYMTFSQELSAWIELVEDAECWVYPCNNHWKTPRVTRAWAKLMYQRGAHGLHLFNWGHLLHGFDAATPPTASSLGSVWLEELHPCYYQSLHEIGDPAAIARGDSVYDLESVPHCKGPADANHRQMHAIHPIELPIELQVGRHTVQLPCAEELQEACVSGHTPVIALRLKITNYTAPDEFDVLVNGTCLDPRTRTTRAVFIMDNDTWATCPLPDHVSTPVLLWGTNELALDVHKLNPQMSAVPVLTHVELCVEY
jgi:hypothetical protein